MSGDSGNYTRGFIIGAIVGGISGAITALLLAPKSGVELRKDISDQSVEYYTKAADYFKTMEGKVGDGINERKLKAQGIMDNARHKAGDILHDAESVIKDARMKASNAKEQIQDRIENIRDAAKAGTDAFKAEMKSNDNNK
jgi:gas vesicle protein